MDKELKNEANNDVNIEKCVVCGSNTGYLLVTPISDRQFYVEGAGQLCHDCYYEIYGKKKED